jgi:hypothetical protein
MMVTFDRSPFGMEQAVIPVMNAVALFESALAGRIPAGPTAVTFLVLAATAAVVLAVAGKAAMREDTWFDPKLTLRRLLAGGRRST